MTKKGVRANSICPNPLKLWWRRRDLNPRPPPCEGDALPAELLPHRWNSFVFRGAHLVKTWACRVREARTGAAQDAEGRIRATQAGQAAPGLSGRRAPPFSSGAPFLCLPARPFQWPRLPSPAPWCRLVPKFTIPGRGETLPARLRRPLAAWPASASGRRCLGAISRVGPADCPCGGSVRACCLWPRLRAPHRAPPEPWNLSGEIP